MTGGYLGTADRVAAQAVTGPGAAAIKYDILTALLVTASNAEAVEGRLAMRLSLLITARFNWRSGVFCVGQSEMARMWGVTTRTTKREIAAMKAIGWLSVARQATRGRVAEYRIHFDRVLQTTMPHWEAVGPDFVARMVGVSQGESAEPSNVVPLRKAAELPEDDGSGWAAAAERLRAQDVAAYDVWLAPLRPVGLEQGIFTIMATTKFQATYVRTHFQTRILAALLAEDSGIREVEIISL